MYIPPALFQRHNVRFQFRIREVESYWDRRSFVRLPWHLYQDDRYWTAPRFRDQMTLLDPRRNPLLRTLELALFMAEAPGPFTPDEVVGTVAAWIDPRRNAATGEAIGYFGLFETINRADVAKALLAEAEEWLVTHLPGIAVIRGPVSLHPAHGPGLLVDGFDTGSSVMMPYNGPYCEELIGEAGYEPAAEWLTYRLRPAELTAGDRERLARRGDELRDRWGLTVRSLDPRSLSEESRRVQALSDATWAPAAGLKPLSDEVLAWLARNFARFLDPSLCLVVERAGQWAALSLAVPDISPERGAFDPTRSPLDRLTHALARGRKDHLKVFPPLIRPRQPGLDIAELLCAVHIEQALARGCRSIELSPVPAEDQAGAAQGLALGACIAQRFRVYEKQFEAGW